MIAATIKQAWDSGLVLAVATLAAVLTFQPWRRP